MDAGSSNPIQDLLQGKIGNMNGETREKRKSKDGREMEEKTKNDPSLPIPFDLVVTISVAVSACEFAGKLHLAHRIHFPPEKHGFRLLWLHRRTAQARRH